MTDEREQLQQRLETVERARDELGEQVEHLVELLEESRKEIRWLKKQLAERDGETE